MEASGLVVALAQMAPPGVATGARLISDADKSLLLAEEQALVANAVAARQREFATGRALLRCLIGTSASILVGPTRAPSWPAGVVGSLAHDRSVAVAAVSRLSTITALGIDVEPIDQLPADMARVILRDDEEKIDAHLAFTLKEAAYKAWSGSGGGMLEHHDVRLDLPSPEASADSIGRRFTATVVAEGTALHGRWAVVDDWCVALVVVQAAAEPEPDPEPDPELRDGSRHQ